MADGGNTDLWTKQQQQPAKRPPTSPPLPSFSTTTPATPSSSSGGGGPALSAALSPAPPTTGGSPLLRNTTIPPGRAGVRLHKTLSLGEKKQAIALPVVSVTALNVPSSTDALRRFPPPDSHMGPSAPKDDSTRSHAESVDKPRPHNQPTNPFNSSGSASNGTDDRHPVVVPQAEKSNKEGGRNFIVFPSLAEMADTEAGKKASLSLCSDGAPSVQFRRHFLVPETGLSLYASLLAHASWKQDREAFSPKLAWFGDPHTELTSAGAVVKHEEWSRIPLLRELRDKLETEFHATFNAVLCSHFRSGSEFCGSYPEDALTQDTDAVFICLGQKRNLLLSPKPKTKEFSMGGKLPHVRVVMETNAALFVHRAARSLYDYSVPQCDDHSAGGNMMLCFRRLAASPKKTPVSFGGELRSSAGSAEDDRAGATKARARENGGPSREAARSGGSSVNSSEKNSNVIYIEDEDERDHGPTDPNRELSRNVTADQLRDYVGRIFYTKHDLSRLGIHQSYMSSICGNMEKGADSILLSDPGAPPVNERLLYTCVTKSHENQVERAILQVNVLNDTPVRLVRGWRADYEKGSGGSSGSGNGSRGSSGSEKDDERMWYRYDGLYSVRNYVDESSSSSSRDDSKLGSSDGAVLCEFLLTRLPLYAPPQPPKREAAPKPTLPSISSLTSLPLPPSGSPFRGDSSRKLDPRQGDYLSRDYEHVGDDDGVEIIEVKPAHAHHPYHHPASSSSSTTSSSSSSSSSSPSYSQQQQQQQQQQQHRLPPYSQLLPSPQRQQLQSQPQQTSSTSSVPLPGILPYMKSPSSSSSSSSSYGPSPSGSSGATPSKQPNAPPPQPTAHYSLPSASSSHAPLSGLGPLASAGLAASHLPPSPPSSSSNNSNSSSNQLNAAMLMYSLFGLNPLQAHGLAPAHGLTPFESSSSSSSSLPRPLASVSLQPSGYQQAREEREQLIALTPAPVMSVAVQPPIMNLLQPSLYEVPTAQLLFFMNLIPQKDREIAQIMRHKEHDEAKRKRKEEHHDNKRKRRKKEEAAAAAAAEAQAQAHASKKRSVSKPSPSNHKPSSSSKMKTATATASVDEEYDLGLDPDNEDDEIIINWSSRRRGAAGQKRSEVEWEKVKEMAAAERSAKRSKKAGGGRDRPSAKHESSTESEQAPPVVARSREPALDTNSHKRSRSSDRRGRSGRDDEGSIFCICRSPEEYGFMIACDKCNEWFHGGCVGLTPAEGQDMKTYICPRCQPPNPRKKILPFGDTLSFTAPYPPGQTGARTRAGVRKRERDGGDDDEVQVDEEKVDWKELGEVVYCGDGDMTDDYESDDPSGFVFVAYVSFEEIAKEREEARKTRDEWIKKKQQQKYLQQRLQEMIKKDQQTQRPGREDDHLMDQEIAA